MRLKALGVKKSNSSNKFFKPELTYEVVQVSCGLLHAALLSKAGDIYTFGSQDNGRLGYSTKVEYQKSSKTIENVMIQAILPQVDDRGVQEKFIQIA